MKKKSFYLTEAETKRQILVTQGSFDYATTPTEDEINDATVSRVIDSWEALPEGTNSIVCLCGETFYVTEKLSDISYQLDSLED